MTAYCPNCLVYNWKSEGVSLSRCSSCNFISYCSKECQREHWAKLHKKQCSTLAGKEEFPGAIHLPGSCSGCQEEMQDCEHTVRSSSSSAWGCILPRAECAMLMGDFQSAVEMGEMTRKFNSRTEHTVFVMQQIVHKLVSTNCRLARECKEEMDGLNNLLARMRSSCRITYHLIPSKFIDKDLATIYEDPSHIREIFLDEFMNQNELLTISHRSSTLSMLAGDDFLAWDSFKLLTGFLFWSNLNNKHKDFENLEITENVPGDLEVLVANLGTSAQFEELWDQVLAALAPGLVHHYELLDILCGGSRDQRCAQCDKAVNIQQIYTMDVDKPPMILKKPFVTFRRKVFSCSEFFCQVMNMAEEVEFHKKISSVINSITSRLVAHRCDYCGLLGKRAHRCKKCKTKVYCNQDCQSKDWTLIHKKICNKGEVDRKKKWNNKERRVLGEQAVEELTDNMANNSNICPLYKEWILDTLEQMQ